MRRLQNAESRSERFNKRRVCDYRKPSRLLYTTHGDPTGFPVRGSDQIHDAYSRTTPQPHANGMIGVWRHRMCIKVRCQSVRDSEEVALPISPQSGSCRAWRLAGLDFDGMDMRMPEIQYRIQYESLTDRSFHLMRVIECCIPQKAPKIFRDGMRCIYMLHSLSRRNYRGSKITRWPGPRLDKTLSPQPYN